MDGSTQQFGSVASVTTIKNPIKCARKLLDNNKYIFLSGKGAEDFASLNSLEIVSNEYFHTDKRRQQVQKIAKLTRSESIHWLETNECDIIKNYGTVGCVCLDKYGNLAAATSTGGTNNKPMGRIGDSAVIGSGTYANNETCAVSCTGKGEPIMRVCNAFNIHAQMKYGEKSLLNSCESAIEQIKDIDSHAGFIAVDKNANVVTMFNTALMGRGYIKHEKCLIYVYDEKRDLSPTKYPINI
jgi:beta-aspartyl-peptidase (threonine type)